ncbi:hypothetical protein EJ110_NYTH30503 [Nymphaea thermarum]|nr:hypothetical protein EJ110_NYTH30503 [Nymphaea thermarum]
MRPLKREAFSSLHILDISSNHLSGSLPQELFTSLRDMMMNWNGYLSDNILSFYVNQFVG